MNDANQEPAIVAMSRIHFNNEGFARKGETTYLLKTASEIIHHDPDGTPNASYSPENVIDEFSQRREGQENPDSHEKSDRQWVFGRHAECRS
jgi:hypothetical protein